MDTMDTMFSDLYVDYLATTGYNVGGAGGRIAELYDGEKDGQYSVQADIGGITPDGHNRVPMRRNTRYQFAKHSGTYGLAGFNEEFLGGVGARMSLDASNRFLLNRMQEDQSDYKAFEAETLKTRGEFDAAMAAMDAQDIAFQQSQAQTDALRSQATSSTSSSSVGAYSQAARKQMQSTLRYANTLKNFKAPGQATFDTTFIDPLTGQTRDMSEDFDETTAYNAFSTKDDVRTFVNDKFKSRSTEIQNDLWAKTIDKKGLGGMGDDIANPDSDFNRRLSAATEWLDNREGGDRNLTGRAMIGEGADRMSLDNYRNFKELTEEYNQIRTFSEARSVAELSGMDKGYWGGTYQGEASAITGTQAVLRSFKLDDYDLEGFLDKTSEDTYNRFAVEDLNNMDRIRDEYNRRKDYTQQQVANTEVRNRLSKEREETIIMQRRKAQQTFAQQQQEYQSTLAGLGASDDDLSGNVQFAITRPQ